MKRGDWLFDGWVGIGRAWSDTYEVGGRRLVDATLYDPSGMRIPRRSPAIAAGGSQGGRGLSLISLALSSLLKYFTGEEETMTTALDVAQYFIACGGDEGDISNLKLQKLVYYAQGFHLALYGKPLFDDPVEAWTHGPVVPGLYRHYKHHGRAPITEADYDPTGRFTQDQVGLLNEVYAVLGQYSAWKLRDMTHSEPPWMDSEATAGVIPQSAMREYFVTRLK